MLRSSAFLVWLGARAIRALFLPRPDLLIENLALRQQVLALKRERPHVGARTPLRTDRNQPERAHRPSVDRGCLSRLSLSRFDERYRPGGSVNRLKAG